MRAKGPAEGDSIVRSPEDSLRLKKKFTHLIRVLNAHGRFREARARVVPEMLRRGVEFDTFTFTALLSGAAMDRDADAAEEVGFPFPCRRERVSP